MVPDGWRSISLGELTVWTSGGTPSKNVRSYWGGDVPWISAVSMKTIRISDSQLRITEAGLENGGRLADRDSVLLLVRGSELHKRVPIGIATRPVAFNQDVKALQAKQGLLPEYLLYWLVGNESLLLSKVEHTGIGAGKLDTDVMKRLSIQLPPLREQQAITGVLSTIDDKIELNRQMNETLESMARALFKSWFVNFDPIKAKANGGTQIVPESLASIFPDSLHQSGLGEIPSGWTPGVVGDFGEVVCGKTPPTSDPENYGNEMPFVTIPDMHGRVFVTETSKSLSSKGAATQANKTLPPFAVCVSCIATVGLVALTSQRCQTNQQINSVVPTSPASSLYCYFALRERSKEIQSRGSGGSVVLNLNKNQFSVLPILLPPATIVAEYQRLAKPLFDKILLHEYENRNLASLRDTLLQKLISGELRIPDAERIVGSEI